MVGPALVDNQLTEEYSREPLLSAVLRHDPGLLVLRMLKRRENIGSGDGLYDLVLRDAEQLPFSADRLHLAVNSVESSYSERTLEKTAIVRRSIAVSSLDQTEGLAASQLLHHSPRGPQVDSRLGSILGTAAFAYLVSANLRKAAQSTIQLRRRT